MKKPIFIAIFLGFLAFTGVASAQTLTSPVATQADIQTIQKQIEDLQIQLKIQMLLEQIASLKAQIDQILANQQATTQAISAVEQKVTAPTAPAVSVPTYANALTNAKTYCSSDKAGLVFEVGANGIWGTGLVRIYNDSGTVDIKTGISQAGPTMTFGNSADIGTPSYTDNFHYSVKLFDKGTPSTRRLIVDTTGDLVIPTCQ